MNSQCVASRALVGTEKKVSCNPPHTSSSAPDGLTDHPQVDILVLQDKPINFAAENSRSGKIGETVSQINWYFITEHPAPAPHLASPEGHAAITHMC